MASDKGKKVFAGLDSMVSQVDWTPPPTHAEQPRHPSGAGAQAAEARAGYPRVSGDDSGAVGSVKWWLIGKYLAVISSGKWWLIGIGLAVFLTWIGRFDKPSESRQAPFAATAPAPMEEPYNPPPPATSYSSNEELIPPVGTGLRFDRSQMRYPQQLEATAAACSLCTGPAPDVS